MVGTDIVYIPRIAEAIKSEAFKTRTFTERERAYAEEKPNPAQTYAGIFAAKEAVAKALRCGFGHGIMPTDLEISHLSNGVPIVTAQGKALEALGEYIAYVSISHDGDYAVAVAQLEKEEKS